MRKGHTCMGQQDCFLFFLVCPIVYKCIFWAISAKALIPFSNLPTSFHPIFLISSFPELLELIIYTLYFTLTISHPFLFLISAIWFWSFLWACSILFFVLWRWIFHSFFPTSALLSISFCISSVCTYSQERRDCCSGCWRDWSLSFASTVTVLSRSTLPAVLTLVLLAPMW